MASMFPQTLNRQAMQQGVPDEQQAPPAWVNPYDALIAQARAQMQQQQAPMFTPEQIEQRRSQNEQEYGLGVLGQISGDQALGGVGAQVFKQALANRTPKITERGTSDPLTGQFTYSPDFLRERDEQQVQGLEQRRAQAEAMQFEREQQRGLTERMERERAADRDATRALQRELGLGRIAAGKGKGENAQDARMWTAEDRMFDDYRQSTKTGEIVLGAHRALQATAQRQDAASDIAFIFQYMKMLDPTSVVREGEFATAQNAAGVPTQILNAYNKTLTGQRLAPQQRADMLGAAGRLAVVAQDTNDSHTRSAAEKAKRRGLDVDAVTGGAWGELQTRGPKPGAAPAAIDVGAALKRPAPPPQALPQSNPRGPNRLVEGTW